MKLFHLSDLHIGLKLMNYDLKEDQKWILDQIIREAALEQPDAVLIAGDIYDKAVPSAEAVELLDYFIDRIRSVVPNAALMLISGNHDSASRINCFSSLLKRNNVHIVGFPPREPDEYIEKVTLQDDFGKVHFYLLPFVKPSMVKQITGTDKNGNNLTYNEAVKALIDRETINTEERNVIVSHQFYIPKGSNADEVERSDLEIRTVGNIDEVSSEILDIFDYAALGHIHKPMEAGSHKIRYCGTPIACSVSEANQKKGIIVVELTTKKEEPFIRTIPLSPLRSIKIIKGTLEEILTQSCEDYVTLTLTDTPSKDVFDTQDRLRAAFPYLLEIRRENVKIPDYSVTANEAELLNPYELCCSFLKDVDETEKEILRDVINTVWEEE